MKRLKYLRHTVVAMLIATLLCNRGMISTYGAVVVSESAAEQPAEQDYVDDEVIVVLEDADASTLRAEGVDEEVENVGSDMQFVVVELEDDMSVEEAVDYYSSLPGVAYAQPNYIYEPETVVLDTEASNDPQYSNQWYLDYMNVDKAWEYMSQVSCSKVRVAVIDTGIDLTHPDLIDNVNTEYCVNSVTDDYEKVTGDETGHGTHVAGTIGAVTGNGTGIAGITNNYAEIAAIQCHNGQNILSSYVIRGIQYAIQIDADVINMSLGMSAQDFFLEEALQAAYDAGIVVVCSAGNDGTDNKHYPSAYSSTIGIIATQKDGTRWTSGSYGTDNFISAPGYRIVSTVPGGTYSYYSGSSMAAGVATGIVADMLAVNPSLSVEEVKTILAETATDTYETGFDADSGWGVIAADKAVARAIELAQQSGLQDTQDPSDSGQEDTSEKQPDEIIDELPNTTEGFVKRLYRYCLNREADDAGLADWMQRLDSKRENGGQVAAGFLFSDEFQYRNLNDEQYVDILYRVFLNREADAAGKADWLSRLQNGMSRKYVMNGFSASEEFSVICRQCGFEPGIIDSGEMRDRNEGVTAFVARLYAKALGRTYDVDGLNDWCGRILSQGWSAYRVSTEGFFHSREFANQNVSNAEFVKILYRTFLDREYDDEGYHYWLGRLNSGESRDTVIAGFANSREFANLMAKYGL